MQDELVAPTVKDCQGRSVWQLAEEANSLIQRARMRKLQPADYADGTFTISNLGMFGVDRFYAIITPPQSSILSVSSIAQRPVVRDGQDRDRLASRRSACRSTTAWSTACAPRSSWPRSSGCSKGRASWSRMATVSASPLEVRRLGRVPYADALALQEELRARLGRGEIGETVLLLEHPDVVTFGRGAKPENALAQRHRAASGGLRRVPREPRRRRHLARPGPARRLSDPRPAPGTAPTCTCYLRALESVLIAALADFGLAARRREGFAGVWLDERRKIASIGVGLRRWLTLHGFALNVDCDLSRFGAIVPCGLAGVEMVSMASVARPARRLRRRGRPGRARARARCSSERSRDRPGCASATSRRRSSTACSTW